MTPPGRFSPGVGPFPPIRPGFTKLLAGLALDPGRPTRSDPRFGPEFPRREFGRLPLGRPIGPEFRPDEKAGRADVREIDAFRTPLYPGLRFVVFGPIPRLARFAPVAGVRNGLP